MTAKELAKVKGIHLDTALKWVRECGSIEEAMKRKRKSKSQAARLSRKANPGYSANFRLNGTPIY